MTTPPTPKAEARLRLETQLIAAGRGASAVGAVNPPVERASTLVFDTIEALYDDERRTYGLQGVLVHDALRAALLAVEGGAAVEFAPSGLAAIALALLTATRSGEEVLASDSVYGPTRRLLDGLFARYGVAARYFPPTIGAEIADLFTPQTHAVMLESPGSLTFEVQDVPAIAAAAQARGIAVLLDNTWSAGLHFRPFGHGVDLSIQALTKHQAGHADVLLGAVLARDAAWARRLTRTHQELGLGAGSADDAYLTLRGMRTLPLRLAQQSGAALRIAAWLAARPEVANVLHPALPGSPGHDLWRRDFTGGGAVFGVVLHPAEAERVHAMIEGYRLFSLGFSWGGFESLAIPCDPQIKRTAAPWRAPGPLLRYAIGLEHEDDLIADLAEGFARLRG